MPALTTPDGFCTIELAAKRASDLAGKPRAITPNVIRAWARRYGWPVPKRTAGRYRLFSEQDVEALGRLGRFLAMRDERGRQVHQVGDILRRGRPRWPDEPAPRLVPDFAPLRAYIVQHGRESAEHARYLRLIEGALVGRAGGILQALLIEVSCLVHPSRRIAIAWMPALLGLEAWAATDRPFPDADTVRQYIRDQVGSDSIAALLEQVAKPEAKP